MCRFDKLTLSPLIIIITVIIIHLGEGLERRDPGRQIEERKNKSPLLYFLEDVNAYIWSLYLYCMTLIRFVT